MFRKRHPPAGARPGTLMIANDSPPPRIQRIAYSSAALEREELADAASISPPAPHAAGVTWIDVQGFGDRHVIEAIGERFAIHPLALEDVVNTPQRPKTETYDQHQVYITRMVRLIDGQLDGEQVSIFVGRGYVLTFQERHGDVLNPVRERIHQGKGPIRTAGADYLAYALIDAIIDGYYPVIEKLGDELEDLEDRLVLEAKPDTLNDINRIKRHLLGLRRAVSPQRDAINMLVRGDSDYFGETTRLYLRDCYDHCVQLGDLLESYREMAGALLGTYLSSVSNRTNEVMKVLTIMASIFIPLTFMAGIYGMNFEFMPELHHRWAYPTLMALMAGTAAGMLLYFRHLGWIGGRRRREDGKRGRER